MGRNHEQHVDAEVAAINRRRKKRAKPEPAVRLKPRLLGTACRFYDFWARLVEEQRITFKNEKQRQQMLQLFFGLQDAIAEEKQRQKADTPTVQASALKLLAEVDWVTRCPRFEGPAGTALYPISDERMAAARGLVETLRQEIDYKGPLVDLVYGRRGD